MGEGVSKVSSSGKGGHRSSRKHTHTPASAAAGDTSSISRRRTTASGSGSGSWTGSGSGSWTGSGSGSWTGSGVTSGRSTEETPYFSCDESSSDGSEPRPDVGKNQKVRLVKNQCEVCEKVLKDPVITPCGHCICEECSARQAEQPGGRQAQPGAQEDPSCPLCSQEQKQPGEHEDQPGAQEDQPCAVKSCAQEDQSCTVKSCAVQSSAHEDQSCAVNSCAHEDQSRPLSSQEQRAMVLQSVVQAYKERMKKRFEQISDGGILMPLCSIHTEPHSTEGESEKGLIQEHEVWRVEQASRAQTSRTDVGNSSGTDVDTSCGTDISTGMSCNDIFRPFLGREAYIKTVMTTGVAGVGKTVSVHKFVLDWAEGRANQDIDFVFVLPFRCLNLMEPMKYSTHRLLLELHPELAEFKDTQKQQLYEECKVVLVFDGLDECQLELCFQSGNVLCDTNNVATIDVLVINLIQGNLLPSAHVWVTSRPARVNQIPTRYIDRFTEIRGFRDPQKEAYLRKRIGNENMVSQILTHIKSCRSLHIMCQIPAVCSIAATVFQHILKQDDHSVGKLPRKMTEMFTHFLLRQIHMESEMFEGEDGIDRETLLEYKMDIVLRLAELAFMQLQQGKSWLYEDDLMACGFRVGDAALYSNIFREIFKQEVCRLETQQAGRLFSFTHISVLEFLAAFYAIHCAVSGNAEPLEMFLQNISRDQQEENSDKNNRKGVFSSTKREKVERNNLEEDEPVEVSLLKLIIDRAVETTNGHLDHFLRFLVGLSLESNQELLLGLLPETCPSLRKIISYVRALLDVDIDPDSCVCLLRCLAEVKDNNVRLDVQKYLQSRKPEETLVSPALCSALAHRLLQSEEVVEELNLRKLNSSDRGRRRLISAVRCCRRAVLSGCELDERSFERVISALHSLHYPLRELDLSDTVLCDAWTIALSTRLKRTHCRLEMLRLSSCALTDSGCVFLSSMLSSPSSFLRELDLSNNQLQDKGAMLLGAQLESPLCRLETLRIASCGFTDVGCVCLSMAVKAHDCPLKELDLRGNHFKESTAQNLLTTLQDPKCQLHTLRLDHAAILWAWLGPVQYACELTLDPNTAHQRLQLSDDLRQATHSPEEQPHPSHPERFQFRPQVLCSQSVSSDHRRCYWETAWSQDGGISIGVAYGSIDRKGWSPDRLLGYNDRSWCLFYSHGRYSAWHNQNQTLVPENRIRVLPDPKPTQNQDQSESRSASPLTPVLDLNRVGAYLDWATGTLAFYSISSDAVTRLHAFCAVFTEPLYPAFRLREINTSLILC